MYCLGTYIGFTALQKKTDELQAKVAVAIVY